MNRLALLLTLFASPAFADHIKYAPGTSVTIKNATVTLVADASGELQVTSIAGPNVTPGPVDPPPVDPVTPPTGLLETLTAATNAVPAYVAKDTDAKSIAFSINFVAPYLKGNAKASDVTAILKTMADAGMGANATKWTAWWATFDGATKTMTMPQYKAALTVATSALTSNAGFKSGEFMGAESFGLDITQLMKLLEFIMKYLPMILALFA